jgi:WD40 repeat protein
MVLSRPGAPTPHPYLTPSLSVAMPTTCDVSPTGKQVQLLTLSIHALRFSRDQGWVASGSFDRTIKLWDLSRASQAATAPPIMTFTPPESSGAKSSIYALAVDPQGHTIVSGGPERVIRMWDPRASKRIGKLVGHTDNIRAVLLSEDSRCVRCSIFPPDLRPHFLHKQLLTASADGMSASHVKAKVSLITGQPRSSSGLSPRSVACIHLHTIPTLSGRSIHRIRLSRSSTRVTSLALLPRPMLRAALKYRRESVRSFARTSHRQLRA